ncbi:MAG: hypothetical protein R3336_03445, partial [Phycisphaeraceae bacterium]|nr:hypothetical protein [Phycisphaeraceae bacterium]
AGTAPWLSDAGYDAVDTMVTARLKPSAEGWLPWVGSADVHVQSGTLNISAPLTLAGNGMEAREPLSVSGQVAPATVAAWRKRLPGIPERWQETNLARPVTVQANITTYQLGFPVNKAALNKMTVGADVRLQSLSTVGAPAVGLMNLNELVIPTLDVTLPATALADPARPSITAVVRQGEETVTLEASAELASLLEPADLRSMSARAQQVPSAWVDQLAGQIDTVSGLVGPRLTRVAVQIQQSGPDRPIGLRLEAEGENLSAVVPLVWDAKTSTVAIRERASLSGSLAPVLANRWLATGSTESGPQGRLAEPVTWSLALDQMTLGLSSGDAAWALDPTRSGLTGRLALGPATVTGLGKAPLRFEDVALNVASENLTESIRLTLSGRPVRAQADEGETSEEPLVPWRSNTTLAGVLSPTGVVAWTDWTVTTDTTLTQVPVALVDGLMSLGGDVTSGVGEQADLVVKGTWPGALTLKLKGTTASADVPLTISRERVVGLTEDARFLLRVTPALAETLLKWGNPVLIDAEEASDPLVAVVRHEGFNVPMQEFDVTSVAARVDLQPGSLVLKDSWLLTALAGELGKLGSGLFKWDKQQRVNFTELNVKLADGKITTNDMWLVGPTMLLGTQGTVDLVESRADLKVGISSWMLRRVGWLKPVIAKDTVFVLNARGKLEKLKPDVGDFFIQLVQLKARQELLNAAGDLGAILSGGLDLIVKGIRKYESDVAWPGQPEPPEPEANKKKKDEDAPAGPDKSKDTSTEKKSGSGNLLDQLFGKKNKKDTSE